jgi:hypothetical protein
LAPTKLYISSSSAACPAWVLTTREQGRGSNAGVTGRSTTTFFYYGDHGRGTDPQHTRGVADAAAIERQVDHLTADLRDSAAILVVEEKDPPQALLVLTALALGAVGLFARLDDFSVVTVRALHQDRDHLLPPRTILMQGNRTRKLLIWNITPVSSTAWS